MNMNYRTLALRREGRILHVDFDNAPLNLMTIEMAGELFDLAGQLVFDHETSVVVLGSANPEFFIAHFDLHDMFRAMNDPDVPQSKYDDINVIQALTTMWEALPQVTIGLVDGVCRGAGLEFLLATHMRFATPESRFCFPEASGGFLPTGGGTTRLALQIGPARAREVILSSRDFDGEEAAAYGIVNRALPADDICAYVDDLAQRLAARSAGSVAAVNEVFAKVYNSAVDAQFSGFGVENHAMRTLLAVPEVQEYLHRLAGHQDVEHELDLPATIAAHDGLTAAK
ncbi:enoyl-CoA hydratase/isomerase family protein [Streptomyces sp. Li-HN-5-11]|uniref:enoyl-CoA hydratase/isomerase family protein n=1 Tax=Streptomyces sp. Li-HN-5-11 TaxID=3075432 RepID=UPI0028B26654|nr:enoyl-CoA hydratase/isomerase family protein [Streptomyces sp. Li-HN-5-11]WNM31718.1 enoyl-CoA hydratase/isomerase family protein [Streptomyces sp. Li-HN-5-11]